MGIIIGVAKIIPGVSGAVLAISFGIYDRGLYAITHFFNDIKNNFLFLGSLGIGVLGGIILFSKVILYLINNYYVMVMLLFTGLVLGGVLGIGKIIKKNRINYIIIFLSLIGIILLGISNIDNCYVIRNDFMDYVMYFLSGIMEAIGTVVPGVSSTALLMIMGMYDRFIEMVANVNNVMYLVKNIGFILSFGLGLGLGVIVICLVMDYCFRKYRDKTYAFIMGISIGSVILMLVKSFIYEFEIIDLGVGILLFILGIIISYRFGS